jgi:hypothetical protein
MKRALVVVILAIAAVAASAQSAQNPVTLPLQHMVFVIDNSGSMEGLGGGTPSDPLRLRGVAACLVLDAAEISSNVEAGLVLFSDQSQTDGKLHPPDVIRQRLHAGRLPPADGGTNMYDAMAKAIAMLAGSPAPTKRIVLITDGMPTDDPQGIISKLVPNAAASGIQIFALGMSKQVDKNFLDAVTKPTNGMTLIAEQHTQLLQRAKELMGDRDNVFVLAETPLASTRNEYEFTIAPGVDRARVTAILDFPSDFTPGALTWTLEGPPSAGERPYVVRTKEGDRVAAWTAFFSTPGTYKLKVTTTNPGGHKGMRLFVEALSNLRLGLTLNPPSPRYEFGSEVKVLVQAQTASGSLDPATLTLSGTVLMPGGGTEVITFSGAEGTFHVRDVAGRHTVIVKGVSALARAEARTEYQATPMGAVQLTSTPGKLDFIRPLGPLDPQIEATFKLAPQFPASARTHAVRVGFMLGTPTGEAELVAKGGGTIRVNGPALFSVPPGGTELTLRIKLDPNRPLPKTAGKQTALLRVYSNEALGMNIPCEYRVNIPLFEVRQPLKTFALWWDPLQPRVVRLGNLHTDLATSSTYTITVPDTLLDPNRGTKIADVVLHVDGKTPESEPADAGKVRYGPLDLEPGKDVVLELLVTPSTTTGWQNLPASRKAFDVELASSLGMQTRIAPAFQTLGPPFWKVDRHGRPLVSFVLLTSFAALLVLLTVSRLREVRRFWPYRPGSVLTLGNGDFLIGDVTAAGAAALVLPNSGSPVDDMKVGRVFLHGREQHVESPSGHLVFVKPKLSPGDTVIVSDDPAQGTQLWELEYGNYVPNEGGEMEVRTSPAAWTLGRVVRNACIGAVCWWGLSVFLGAGIAAALAYHFGFIESFYLWVLR